ncbi:MAG: VanZ family protein [Chloroflexi bacterium]|jgi:VanZ family protein|nr:VanZ family protein [Chloroflexota bacterium]MBT4073091.1 VanZ family protein [Chloroflexota bacterium]MBT4514363.1 VanZ family protein [Chloroflexota bacterium]MBT6682312.1 VanZ family protein [Chloroflexota bacterium]
MSTESPQTPSGRDTTIHFLRYGLPVFLVMGGIFAASQMSASTIDDSAAYDSASGIFGEFTSEVAHFVEYFVLSVLVLRWVFAVKVPSNEGDLDPALVRSSGQRAVLITILYGVSDEAHQWFIDGRSVELLDLLIDSIGAVMGSAVYLSVFQAWRLQRQRGKDS